MRKLRSLWKINHKDLYILNEVSLLINYFQNYVLLITTVTENYSYPPTSDRTWKSTSIPFEDWEQNVGPAIAFSYWFKS